VLPHVQDEKNLVPPQKSSISSPGANRQHGVI
jgi:hypothetical protein